MCTFIGDRVHIIPSYQIQSHTSISPTELTRERLWVSHNMTHMCIIRRKTEKTSEDVHVCAADDTELLKFICDYNPGIYRGSD